MAACLACWVLRFSSRFAEENMSAAVTAEAPIELADGASRRGGGTGARATGIVDDGRHSASSNVFLPLEFKKFAFLFFAYIILYCENKSFVYCAPNIQGGRRQILAACSS